jgi:hypothetical protein
MPRKPFLPQHRGKPWSIGVYAEEAPPVLKQLIGDVAINWSHVENHLALTMGSLLGIENSASVAVFIELRNNRSRRDALEAAAKAVLPENELLIFHAIMNIHRSLDGQRNDVVHGIWGFGSNIGQSVLWKSVQDNAVAHIRDYHARRPDYIDPNFQVDENHQTGMFVYALADISHLRDDITALSNIIRDFHSFLRYRDHVAGESALRQLNETPLLQKEISRMNGLS